MNHTKKRDQNYGKRKSMNHTKKEIKITVGEETHTVLILIFYYLILIKLELQSK